MDMATSLRLSTPPQLPFAFSCHQRCQDRHASARNRASSASSASISASVRVASSHDADAGFVQGPFVEGELNRPSWTGDEPLSRFLTALFSFKPLFSVLSFGARQVFINSAEKKGIPWRKLSDECLASDVYAEKDLIENPSVEYPEYYLKNFHGYPTGNLSWKAASEADPATASMVLRAVPDAKDVDEANDVLRGNWIRAIENHLRKYSIGHEIRDVLDVGCSIGVSTSFLADKFPSAQVTGLDLSPYFLAVARHREKQFRAKGPGREKPINWLHAKGEDTGLPLGSFDIVSIAYVVHECPQYATRALLKEAFRLLRPGGTVVLTDIAPKSKVLQNLPPVLFTLMKSTEPWIDEYFSMNLEGAMEELGFQNVTSVLTDRRHRTVTATVPKSH